MVCLFGKIEYQQWPVGTIQKNVQSAFMKHSATRLNDKIKYCLVITLVCNTLSIREGAPATPTIIGVGRKGAGSDRRRASSKII